MGCCFTKDFQSSGAKARGKGKEAGREEKPWRGHISRLVTSEHNWLLNLTASPSQKLRNCISGSLFRRRKERYYPSPHFSTVEGCHRAHHFRTGLSMGGPWAVSQGSHLLSISRKDSQSTWHNHRERYRQVLSAWIWPPSSDCTCTGLIAVKCWARSGDLEWHFEMSDHIHHFI